VADTSRERTKARMYQCLDQKKMKTELKMPRRAKRQPMESTTISLPRAVNWKTIVPRRSKWIRDQT
jgi:hypothetical protein